MSWTEGWWLWAGLWLSIDLAALETTQPSAMAALATVHGMVLLFTVVYLFVHLIVEAT